MDPCERCKLLIVSGTLRYLIGVESCSLKEIEMADGKFTAAQVTGVVGKIIVVCGIGGLFNNGTPLVGIPIIALGIFIWYYRASWNLS